MQHVRDLSYFFQPLEEVYNFLHSFAQMLQLDVLFCQATQVFSGDMCQYAVIERYDRNIGNLILAYWLKRTHNRYHLFDLHCVLCVFFIVFLVLARWHEAIS